MREKETSPLKLK